ncbi:MAG: WD40 repeat domain-containing protein [Anaerolineae bacterium]|nr:WD40 repeat domain-containing protein [Anaerolineae bacterium]
MKPLFHRRGAVGLALILILLSACSFDALLPPIPTGYVIPTVTLTPTARPSATPGTTPTEMDIAGAGTALPPARAPINTQNLRSLAPFARQGKGLPLCLALSPDGKSIAVGSTRGISLFDGESLKETLFIKTNFSQQALAFAADGTMLASAGADGFISLWSLPDGTLQRRLKTDFYSYTVVLQFSPDGSRLISSDAQRVTRIWSVTDGSQSGAIVENARIIRRLSFSDQENRLFSWAPKEPVKIWNLDTGSKVRDIFVGQDELGRDTINGDFSDDGAYFAANSGLRVRIFRTKTGTTRQLLRLTETARYVLLSPDGSELLVIFANQMALYRVESRDAPLIWDLPAGGLPADTKISFSADGRGLWFISDAPKYFDLGSGAVKQSGTPDFAPDYVLSEVFTDPVETARERVFLNGSLQTLDAAGRIVKSSVLTGEAINAAALAPDGETIALTGRGMGLTLWSPGGERLARLDDDFYTSLSFSETGLLAAARPDGRINIWDVKKSDILYSLNNADSLQQVMFSSDGSRLAARTTGQVSLWSLAEQKVVATFDGCAMCFSPDGSRLAVLSSLMSGQFITVYESASGKKLQQINHTTGQNVAFSSDNNLLVTAGDFIRFYSLSDASLIQQIPAGGLLGKVRFVDEDRLLAISANDGSVLFWGIP